MFMKFVLTALLIAAIVLTLCIGAFAVETVVYVNSDSTGGDGSAAAPFATLKEAVAYFDGGEGGEIVLLSTLQLTDGYEISADCAGQIVITAKGGGLSFGGKLYINAPIRFENVNMNFTADIPMLFCEGNNVTFGKGITTSYKKYAPIIYGGTYGGKQGVTYEKMCFSDYTVRIESGTWYYVKGGSYRDGEGQPVGTLSDVTLEITGGNFTAKSGASNNAFISLTGFDALLGNGTVNISGGSFSAPIVGISRPGYNSTTSNNQYVKGNVYINVSGGTFVNNEIRAVQDSVSSEIDGDFYVSITGGNFTGFSGVDGSSVNGLAIADVKSGISVKNCDRLITLENGGTATVTGDALIRIRGAVSADSLAISGNGRVVIEGVTESAKITVDNVWDLGADTEIRNIALDGHGTGIISCSDGKILIDEGITGSGVALKNFTDATLRSGLFAYVRGASEKDVKLHIDGARVSSNVVAVSGGGDCEAYVLVSAGSVGGNIYAFDSSGRRGAVHVLTDDFKGKICVARNPTAGCVDYFGAVAPEGAEISYAGCVKYNAPTEAVFVADGGTGDGTSPLCPLGDLSAAVKAANGKTVVVCGRLRLKSTLTLPKADAKTVITSEYMGINYRDFYGALIELSAGLCLSGETVFENIGFEAFEKYTYILANGNPLTVGEGVECSIFEGKRVEKYPTLIGAAENGGGASVKVASGVWSVLAGGCYYTSDSVKECRLDGDVKVTVTGGKFVDGVYLAGRSTVSGDATLDIYGGVFECPVRALYKDGASVLGKSEINICGGSFCGDIIGGGNDFTLNISGGDLDRVCTVNVCGRLNTGSEVNLDAKISGTADFTNPIAGYADPSVTYHDGWYYYSFAKDYLGQPALWMARAANIFDIGNAEPVLVWAAAGTVQTGTAVLSLWAPQLYYIQGRWYLYATCDIGLTGVSGNARRMPIIWRALTDDPIGGYEYIGLMKNTDTDVYSYLSPRFIEHGGKLYMFNGGFYREADCSGQHIQRMFVSELSDPTTMASSAHLISSPVYDYENGIMEGPYPFYAPDGTLYMIFAAGHTRTDEYCTGLMRFTGSESDSLLDATKWEKYDRPIHKVSYENKVYSPGAMIVTRNEDGEYLAVYHAKEYHYSAYTMRRMYVQKMTFENGLPTVQEPQPTDTLFTFKLSSLPLSERISGITEKGMAERLTTPPASAETEYIAYRVSADVNSDGYIGLLDALVVAGEVASGKYAERSDLDFSGSLDTNDIRIALREIAE